MKKYCFGIVGVLLLFTACVASRNQMDVSGKGVVSKNNISSDTVRGSFYRRLVERLVQLCDYMEIITNDNLNEESQLYYVRKAKGLFAPSANVCFHQGNETETLPLDSFFLMLAKGDLILQRLDSIEVPTENWENLENQDSLIYANSRRISLPLSDDTGEMCDTKLPVLVEKTEDGIEQIPMLGDLTVKGHLKKKSLPAATISFNQNDTMLPVVRGNMEKVLFKTKIKLVDEFFDRFNSDAGRIDVKEVGEEGRRRNLLLLFDGEMFASFEDSLFLEAVSMVDVIMSNQVHLSFSDTTWFAKALCQATYKEQATDIIVWLNVEHRREDMYKWVINKVEGDILKLDSPPCSEKIMLMPNVHETNFLSLYRITTEKDDYIINYMRRDFPLEETSVFLTRVYDGLLDIDYVKNLEFVFYQVPGYVFTIKYFERDKYNAGWLINSFRRLSDKEKAAFLTSMYHSVNN